MSDELLHVHQTLLDFQNTQLRGFNPDHEVVTTIVSMFRNRINKLEAEDRFNDQLKLALIDRLPEATWSEIATLLTSREMTENSKITGLLAPFIPKDGDRIPLIDHDQRTHQIDDTILKNADKEKLQAVETLTQFIDLISSRKNAVKANLITNGEGEKTAPTE
jgi:hypothetical protein